jgi:hypothetical protein
MERFVPHTSLLRISTPESDPDRFLSRALAALSIQKYADISEEDAATSVVDDENDGGIDAIYYSPQSSTLYISQSKWKNSTNGGIPLGDVLKFCQGIRELLQSNSKYFGGPIKERWPAIENALAELSRVVVILAYSSETQLDPPQEAALKDVLDEFNQPTEVATRRTFTQAEIHSYLASGVEGDEIEETLRIFQWGLIEQPHVAYYGQMAAGDLVSLFNKYNQRLFSSNIRQFLGKGGPANSEIIHTATQRPDIFWYFNNGVTIISNKVKKTVIGGAKREVGDIVCSGLSIVNGAQTIGSLSQIQGGSSLDSVMIPVRVISLENGGPDLGIEITKATNTQNRVDSRNFVALSTLHQRIRRDLLMDGVTYVIQQTDIDEKGPKLFGVSEAFPAMACALKSVEPTVIAKREISRLWENLSSSLHNEMFPDNIDAQIVWRNVEITRIVEESLEQSRTTADTSREKTVLAHGNRLASHITFRISQTLSRNEDQEIREIADRVSFFMGAIVADDYPNQYPAVIFKNTEMCKEISEKVCSQVLDSIKYDGEDEAFAKNKNKPFEI